jgi:hypothetical protein
LVGSTEAIETVGIADELLLSAFEAAIETSGSPANVADCVADSNAMDFQQLDDINRTFVGASVVDNDNVELTRIVVDITEQDEDIAQVGDATRFSIDGGSEGVAAFAVICGGATTGTAVIEAAAAGEDTFVQIAVVGVGGITPVPTATSTASPTPTVTAAPCAPNCPPDRSAAVWCVFLAAAIDGDASPFDFTLSSDYVQACNGLDTFDIRNLASALGDEDDQLEPSDLAGVDLDANQITDMNAAGTVPSNPNNVNGAFFATLDEIYVFAFVDDDGVVTFDSDAGLTVHVNTDNGGYSVDADANTETCVGVDDLDCDDSTPNTDDGDGIVVATLIDATGDAGDDVDVHVEQEGEVSTEVS